MDKAKVLIVEDNRIVAEDIKNNLEEMGYAISAIATTGEKALEAVEIELPDIALMDIRLGKGMNGIETATYLFGRYHLPIIYLTAHADEETLAQAKLTEPYAYLVKPFDAEELQSSVEVALYKHRVEREIRKSRQWLQTTLTSIGDGVIATDEKGCVKFMNPVAETLTGWTQSDALGEPLDRVFHIVNEQTRAIVENPVKKVLDTGQIIGLANHTVLISRDGREIPIKDSGAPILIDGNTLTGVVLVFQDDTASRIAENRVRQSQERLQLAMESAKEGMWEIDGRTLNITFDDLCYKMLGFDRTAVEGDHRKWMLKRVHPDDRTAIQEKVDYILKNPDDIINMDYRLAKKGGEYIWVNSMAKVINNDNNGKGPLLVGIQRDINERVTAEDERRKLEAKLRQSQKMEAVGTLAGGIAHDFNNILASVIGYTEISIDDTEKGSMLHENLKEILVAGLRARDLVRQILMFSRQAEFELKPISLNPLVKETVKLMRATIPSYIAVEDEIVDLPVTVMGNPSQMHQIIVNLCTNASHAMDEREGLIQVNLDTIHFKERTRIHNTDVPRGSYGRIMVRDSGNGIDLENLEKIFDPYFTTKDQGKGTGLGLSIVHGIVKSHNGYVIVDSVVGKGTTFSVYLPRACDSACIKELQVDDEVPGGSERILFVDDELSIVKLQKQNLERLGYRVQMMTNAVDALTLFEAEPEQYDLVITDMAMPKISGDKLSASIKAIRPDIKVILCTGYSEKIDTRKIKDLRIDGYLMKPVENSIMAKTIRHVLDDDGHGAVD